MNTLGKTSLRPALGLCLLLVACRSNPPAAPPSTPAPPATPAAAPTTTPPAAAPALGVKKTYGAPLSAAETLPVSTLVAKPEGYAGKAVTVEGTVRSACTNKGCWMELAEAGQADAPGCRVTFKDYGFFVPTNSAGSKARVQGTFELATVSASRVRHLEGEGATFKNKEPDGTAKELRLVATGVELWR
jgi:hypothetical protein